MCLFFINRPNGQDTGLQAEVSTLPHPCCFAVAVSPLVFASCPGPRVVEGSRAISSFSLRLLRPLAIHSRGGVLGFNPAPCLDTLGGPTNPPTLCCSRAATHGGGKLPTAARLQIPSCTFFDNPGQRGTANFGTHPRHGTCRGAAQR